MSFRRTLATGALLMLFASPSLAQAPDSVRMLNDKQAAQELEIYVNCIVKRRETAARALALAPFGSSDQLKLVGAVTRSLDEDCIQGGFDSVRVSIRSDVLAGAIARRLLARDYPDLPAVVDPAAVNVDAERARTAQLGVPERFGSCIVWNDPAGVQALLRSTPRSAEERQAVAALKEDMGMCLEEGSTLKLDVMFVRNIAAVAAYRLASNLRPLGSGMERG